MVKSLQDVGALRRQGEHYVLTKPLEEIVVPDTIQDVLMARIGRLPEAPKKTLQLTAVIGREFTRRLLERLADIRERIEAYLQELKALELIYERRLFPEPAYTFKHALTQDVAYNSLLVQRRQELHRLIGTAIEELYADRLAEQYEVLAYHFAKGEEWAKALIYFCKAAEKAAEAFATREAIALYDQALELGDLDKALDLNRRGAERARKRGDPETIANAEINLGDIFLAQGDLVLAQQFLDGVYRLANDPATSDWYRWCYSTHLFASLGDLWLARGDPAKAWEFADQCLEIATRTNSRKNLVKGWRLRGQIALARGEWGEAAMALQQALAMAQAIGNPTQIWKTHVAMGRLHAEARRREQAQQAYHAAHEVIDRIKASLQNPGLCASLERSPLLQPLYDLDASL